MVRERRPKNQSFSQKFWEDGHGNFVIWQKPNVYLSTWFLTMVGNWFIHTNWLRSGLSYISLLALIIWAVLEVYNGINYFRRLIGILVLLTLLTSHLA
ncbi:MAG TPA: hypothetical protein VLF39_01860 [Candidatus Saccharimonadales bacterium]|nr:hypothetical protein [Candidatus Saccharimonadales bacterium]